MLYEGVSTETTSCKVWSIACSFYHQICEFESKLSGNSRLRSHDGEVGSSSISNHSYSARDAVAQAYVSINELLSVI
jgi:hypothetical protein